MIACHILAASVLRTTYGVRATHKVLLAKRRVVDGVANIGRTKIGNLALANVAHESPFRACGVPPDHLGARCHKL